MNGFYSSSIIWVIVFATYWQQTVAFLSTVPPRYCDSKPTTTIKIAPTASSLLPLQTQTQRLIRKKKPLYMGLFDDIKSRFLDSREGDFIRLDDEKNNPNEFGPGPLVILYNVPDGVTNEEIQDMMEDGAPQAFRKGIILYRVDECNTKDDASAAVDPVLDLSMKEALEGIANQKYKSKYSVEPSNDDVFSFKTVGMPPPIVVTFFSGFRNDEMLAVYNILGSEIFEEAQLYPACAKAVPNAMEKPLRQILEEIGGDHRDAMQMTEDKTE